MARQQRKKNTNFVIGAATTFALALVGGIFFTVTNDDAAKAPEETVQQAPQTSEVPTQQPETDEQEPQYVEEERAAQIDATQYIEGQEPATEPTYVNGILLANKQYPLPATYNPGVDATAQQAVDAMIAAAKAQSIQLTAFSGFRSYEYQETLYTNYVARDGQEQADRYSARPGHSEHQTGLAFDIGEVGNEDLWLTEAFGETAAGKWLVDNAHEYGFILRYPKGKEHLTGFMYESWHFRYVGKDVARVIKEQDVTLEEYLGVYNSASAALQQSEPIAEDASDEEEMKVGAKTFNNR